MLSTYSCGYVSARPRISSVSAVEKNLMTANVPGSTGKGTMGRDCQRFTAAL